MTIADLQLGVSPLEQTVLPKPDPSVCVAEGYGLKIYVERGHLVVHDGIGRTRETRRFNRATGRLRRLVVIGHSGFITLEALLRLREVGAALVHVHLDGSLITTTAAERLHEAQLRRAQVLAAETAIGRAAIVELLRVKLERQALVADQWLAEFKPSIVRNHRHCVLVSDAIREQANAMNLRHSSQELRKIESIAGRYYWQAWARFPIQFDRSWRGSLPEHWRRAGPRTSRIDRQWPRRATTPAHALLNYGYAILESEALLAAYKMGFDPSLGLMHADVRYRSSLATDLMEPLRPVLDELVLDLLTERTFRKGEFHETRRGVCRLGPDLARELAYYAPQLATATAPIAERLATALLRRKHSTPLTRRNHRDAVARSARRALKD
jgi:CRISPR-associated endonuclease Cas1